MKKTLRLLLFEDCNRSCEGCCNKQWDLSKLPVVWDYSVYDTIILTGGEPMLHPNTLFETIDLIKVVNPTAKIILYTAMTSTPYTLQQVLQQIDGLTVTLHNQQDMIPFLCFNNILNIDLESKTLRLNIFDEVEVSNYQIPEHWQIKDNIEWIEDCPLPDNEVFMRL